MAVCIWLLAATMLLALIVATAVHWLRHPENARRHHHDPAMAPFYGAPPMAILTVGGRKGGGEGEGGGGGGGGRGRGGGGGAWLVAAP